jgi:hypothetical protein
MNDDLAFDLLGRLVDTRHLRWVISRVEGGRTASIVDAHGIAHRATWNRQRKLWIRACDDEFSDDREYAGRQVDCMACVATKGDTP